MENLTRLRINLSTREIEWQGTEEFINKYEHTITDFIESLKNPQTQQANLAHKDVVDSKNHNQGNNITIPESFGEFYVKFPRSNLSVTDKILISAYFIQIKSSDGLFTPKEALDLLTEQSVNVTNVNAFITSLLKTAKLFKSSGKYKVSERGIEIVSQLLNSNG